MRAGQPGRRAPGGGPSRLWAPRRCAVLRDHMRPPQPSESILCRPKNKGIAKYDGVRRKWTSGRRARASMFRRKLGNERGKVSQLPTDRLYARCLHSLRSRPSFFARPQLFALQEPMTTPSSLLNVSNAREHILFTKISEKKKKIA